MTYREILNLISCCPEPCKEIREDFRGLIHDSDRISYRKKMKLLEIVDNFRIVWIQG